mmetsp:Transcript_21347/g.15611  ORF Transcript_21347/g.15611 Transcript_21347/m.15611 type:complete len:144 (+) Transcript_21347:542-973(+)
MRKFSGNFLFASLNSCRGNNKSRRDDVESILYIMIYLLNDNYLPWCEIEKKFVSEGMDFKDVLKERLEIEYTKKLFVMIPKELIPLLKYVLTIKFDEEPNYKYFIEQVQMMMQKESICCPYPKFEWKLNIASKTIQNIINEEK